MFQTKCQHDEVTGNGSRGVLTSQERILLSICHNEEIIITHEGNTWDERWRTNSHNAIAVQDFLIQSAKRTHRQYSQNNRFKDSWT